MCSMYDVQGLVKAATKAEMFPSGHHYKGPASLSAPFPA
jgi:hypothetical protein